jgi:hypothetical protein
MQLISAVLGTAAWTAGSAVLLVVVALPWFERQR